MMGRCHCGQVAITVAEAPAYLNQCNCTLCWKLGAVWGYYPADAVRIAGMPRAYRRTDVDLPMLEANFCPRCGATTHWSPTEHFAANRMGVNMRLFEPAELQGLEVRYGDRRNHDTVEPRRYARGPTRFGDGGVEV